MPNFLKKLFGHVNLPIKSQINVICKITSIMFFLFPYFTYLIICNILRKFKLVCLIAISKVQIKYIHNKKLEGDLFYLFFIANPILFIFFDFQLFKKKKILFFNLHKKVGLRRVGVNPPTPYHGHLNKGFFFFFANTPE